MGLRRRRGEVEWEDPKELSMIRKLENSKIADVIIRIVITLAMGGGAAFAVSEKKGIDTTNAVAELATLKADYDEFRKRNRERNQQRDLDYVALRDRVLILETELKHVSKVHAKE